MKHRLPQLALALTLALPAAAQPRERDGEAPGPDRSELRERFERGDRPGRPDRDGRDGRPDDDRKHNAIPADRIGEAMDTLNELHGSHPSKFVQALERLVEQDPQAAAERLSKFPRLHELMQMRQERPEAFQAHVQQATGSRRVYETVRALRQAIEQGDDNTAQALRAQLRETMRSVLDARLQIKRAEIENERSKLAQAQQKLQEAERELAGLRANQDKLIEEKVAELEARALRGPRRDRNGERDRGRDRDRDRDRDREREQDAENQAARL